MNRLLSLPVWIVLLDMIYGVFLNVSQNFKSRPATSISDGLAVTPDIAFDSLQLIANGGMVLIIGFGLITLLQLNRFVLKKQILPIGIFRTLGLVAVLAFSLPALLEWLYAIASLFSGQSVLNLTNVRYLVVALCMPPIAILCIVRLYHWYRLYRASESDTKAENASEKLHN